MTSARATALVLALCATGCGQRGPRHQVLSGETMGTTFTVQVIAPLDAAAHANLRETIVAELERVDELMSTWREDSELQALNRHAGSGPFPLSSQTFDVLTLARDVSRDSGGAFDVTVGPLVNAWGFGPPGEPPVAPDAGEIERLRAAIGWRLLELDPETSTVRKAVSQVNCDLSAIAKGYGVDRIALALDELGITRYLIEIGGELRARGPGRGGRPWRVGIERPDPAGLATAQVVSLENLSLATSGDYRHFYERDGRRYTHAIDPRDGRPIEHATASVSVMHPSCALADAWATALLVLGPTEGPRVARQQGLAALFLTRVRSGGFETVTTPSWRSEP